MDLTTFQHSLFLHALGNAILNSMWQGFLLWIVYETIIISYKNRNAKFKHNLCVLFIATSFIWFIITLISRLLISQKIALAPGINNINTVKGTISPFHEILSFAANMLPYLSIAYILLLFFLMIKLFAAYKYVHFISKKNLIAPSQHLQNFAAKVAFQLKILKKIEVWISNNIEVPATIGFIKPVILIPFASVNNLSVYQLEAIILHEFSHIKRNDYLVNLLVSIIETVLFFNPFIAVFVKIIKRERENCCDDLVLQYQYDPHSYASALLRLEQSRKATIQLALGAVSGKKQLLSRVKRITGTDTVSQFNYGQKLFALLIITGIFCSLAWLSPSNIKKENAYISLKNNLKVPPQSHISIKENIITEAPSLKTEILPGKNEADKITLSETEKKTDSIEKGKMELISDKQLLEELIPARKSNFKRFENIPKIQLENLDVDIAGEINKGLHKAYIEINKINWKKVQNDINKSLSEINFEGLPKDQKAAISEAKRFFALINLNKQNVNAAKIVEQIQNQQKKNPDSIRQGDYLKYQLRRREQQENEKLQNADNITDNSVFTFDNELHNIRIERKNPSADRRDQFFEINGRELKLNVQKESFFLQLPTPAKKIKQSKKVIIEI